MSELPYVRVGTSIFSSKNASACKIIHNSNISTMIEPEKVF